MRVLHVIGSALTSAGLFALAVSTSIDGRPATGAALYLVSCLFGVMARSALRAGR